MCVSLCEFVCLCVCVYVCLRLDACSLFERVFCCVKTRFPS